MATVVQAVRMALHVGETQLGVTDIFGEDVGPPLGGVFATGGAFWKITCGPKVLSSTLGPKLPEFSGPATNSQKGVNSVNLACAGVS